MIIYDNIIYNSNNRIDNNEIVLIVLIAIYSTNNNLHFWTAYINVLPQKMELAESPVAIGVSDPSTSVPQPEPAVAQHLELARGFALAMLEKSPLQPDKILST